jgi:hypothetical protein
MKRACRGVDRQAGVERPAVREGTAGVERRASRSMWQMPLDRPRRPRRTMQAMLHLSHREFGGPIVPHAAPSVRLGELWTVTP